MHCSLRSCSWLCGNCAADWVHLLQPQVTTAIVSNFSDAKHGEACLLDLTWKLPLAVWHASHAMSTTKKERSFSRIAILLLSSFRRTFYVSKKSTKNSYDMVEHQSSCIIFMLTQWVFWKFFSSLLLSSLKRFFSLLSACFCFSNF